MKTITYFLGHDGKDWASIGTAAAVCAWSVVKLVAGAAVSIGLVGWCIEHWAYFVETVTLGRSSAWLPLGFAVFCAGMAAWCVRVLSTVDAKVAMRRALQAVFCTALVGTFVFGSATVVTYDGMASTTIYLDLATRAFCFAVLLLVMWTLFVAVGIVKVKQK